MENKKVLEYLVSENKPKLFKDRHLKNYVTVSDVLNKYKDLFIRLNTITNKESVDESNNKTNYIGYDLLDQDRLREVDDGILFFKFDTFEGTAELTSSRSNCKHQFKGLNRFLSDDFTIKGNVYGKNGDILKCFYKGKPIDSIAQFFEDEEFYELTKPNDEDFTPQEIERERKVFNNVCKTTNYYAGNGNDESDEVRYNLGPVALTILLMKELEEYNKLYERNRARKDSFVEMKQPFYHIFPIKLSNGDYLLFKYSTRYMKEFRDYGLNPILLTDKLTGKKEMIELKDHDFNQNNFNLKVDLEAYKELEFLFNDQLFTDIYKYKDDIEYMKKQFERLLKQESIIEGKDSSEVVDSKEEERKAKKEQLKNEIIELRNQILESVNNLNGLIDESNDYGEEQIPNVYLDDEVIFSDYHPSKKRTM